jgi:hypothetical protein
MAISLCFSVVSVVKKHFLRSHQGSTSNVEGWIRCALSMYKSAEGLVRRWAFDVRCQTFGSLLHALHRVGSASAPTGSGTPRGISNRRVRRPARKTIFLTRHSASIFYGSQPLDAFLYLNLSGRVCEIHNLAFSRPMTKPPARFLPGGGRRDRKDDHATIATITP